MDLSHLSREDRESLYREWSKDQAAMDAKTGDILDEMKKDAEAQYAKDWKSQRERYDFAFAELMRRHIEQQRQWGVAVPSAEEAQKATLAVLERLQQEGI